MQVRRAKGGDWRQELIEADRHRIEKAFRPTVHALGTFGSEVEQ